MIARGLMLAAMLAGLAAGCRTPAPLLPLDPTDPRPRAALAELREAAGERHALRGVARLSLDGPTGSGRAKQIIVLERPDRLRVEVLGFLNQTAAVLVADGETFHWFQHEDGSVQRGAVTPRLLERVSGLRLTPKEAVDLLLGVPAPERAADMVGGALLPDGGFRVDLRAAGAGRVALQQLEFDAEHRLRRVEARGAEGRLLWEARFDDYRRLDGASFAHEIEFRTPTTGARAQLSFREVELNPKLPPDIFVLRLPGRRGARAGGSG